MHVGREPLCFDNLVSLEEKTHVSAVDSPTVEQGAFPHADGAHDQRRPGPVDEGRLLEQPRQEQLQRARRASHGDEQPGQSLVQRLQVHDCIRFRGNILFVKIHNMELFRKLFTKLVIYCICICYMIRYVLLLYLMSLVYICS